MGLPAAAEPVVEGQADGRHVRAPGLAQDDGTGGGVGGVRRGVR
ncbi:hypothetical protein [Kineococcus sp. SYSU DK001]